MHQSGEESSPATLSTDNFDSGRDSKADIMIRKRWAIRDVDRFDESAPYTPRMANPIVSIFLRCGLKRPTMDGYRP